MTGPRLTGAAVLTLAIMAVALGYSLGRDAAAMLNRPTPLVFLRP
jgi:hypothetical protein